MSAHQIKTVIILLFTIILTWLAYSLFKDFYHSFKLPISLFPGTKLLVPLLLSTAFLIFDSLILLVESISRN